MAARFLHILIASCSALASAWGDTGLYVSRHAARILPHRMVSIPAPEAGEIRVFTFGKGRVEEGTLLAILNEELLAMEEQEAEMSIRQQRIERDKALFKLRKHREELEFLRKLPQERRAFAQQRLQTRADESLLASINEEMELLNAKFRLAEDKTQQALRKKRMACTLNMPFDGRLQYHINLPENEGEEVPVPSSAPIVTIIDDSAFYAVLPATDPVWARLEHERLFITIDLGGGEKLRAQWHHMKVDKGDRGETLFYYFLIAPQDNEKAFSLIGSNIIAELFYKGDEGWLYERKSELAMEAGSTPIETWEKLLAVLRPGYDIVFVGETHICLRKKDERTPLPAPVPAA